MLLERKSFRSSIDFRLLLSDRTELRLPEKAFKILLKPITWAFPTAVSTPTATIGEAMVNKTLKSGDTPVEILYNKEIHHLGAEDCKP